MQNPKEHFTETFGGHSGYKIMSLLESSYFTTKSKWVCSYLRFSSKNISSVGDAPQEITKLFKNILNFLLFRIWADNCQDTWQFETRTQQRSQNVHEDAPFEAARCIQAAQFLLSAWHRKHDKLWRCRDDHLQGADIQSVSDPAYERKDFGQIEIGRMEWMRSKWWNIWLEMKETP